MMEVVLQQHDGSDSSDGFSAAGISETELESFENVGGGGNQRQHMSIETAETPYKRVGFRSCGGRLTQSSVNEIEELHRAKVCDWWLQNPHALVWSFPPLSLGTSEVDMMAGCAAGWGCFGQLNVHLTNSTIYSR